MENKEYTQLMAMAGKIQTVPIREFVQLFLREKVPAYFWEIAASSTGKYHPKYALGEGGLARHVIAASVILADLLSLDCWKNQFTQIQIDQMYAAIILHDTFKRGLSGEEHTKEGHELIARDQINSHLNQEQTVIGQLVSAHMGQWGAVKPSTLQEQLVHTADYLASRKHIDLTVFSDRVD